MKRLHFLVCLALVVLAAAVPAVAAPRDAGLYPDLRTVIPTHLGIQNQQQREILRFSNGIANTGPGPWRMRPEPPPGSDTQVTNGVQEILDATGHDTYGAAEDWRNRSHDDLVLAVAVALWIAAHLPGDALADDAEDGSIGIIPETE